FRKLAEQQRSLPSVVERFVSSHPLSEDRVRAVEREVARLPRPAGAPVASARTSTFSPVKLMFAKD
ncbi:MAG TPA: hypothetical protein VGJ70_23990, partial [Solirubrobacteraceae bacterium]